MHKCNEVQHTSWHPGVKDLPDEIAHGLSSEVEIQAKATWDYWQNKWIISEVIRWCELPTMPEGGTE